MTDEAPMLCVDCGRPFADGQPHYYINPEEWRCLDCHQGRAERLAVELHRQAVTELTQVISTLPLRMLQDASPVEIAQALAEAGVVKSERWTAERVRRVGL